MFTGVSVVASTPLIRSRGSITDSMTGAVVRTENDGINDTAVHTAIRVVAVAITSSTWVNFAVSVIVASAANIIHTGSTDPSIVASASTLFGPVVDANTVGMSTRTTLGGTGLYLTAVRSSPVRIADAALILRDRKGERILGTIALSVSRTGIRANF